MRTVVGKIANTNESINHAPIFIGIPVIPSTIIEGNSHVFRVQVSDPDGDPVTIEWYFDSELVSTTDEYNFTAVTSGVIMIITCLRILKQII